MIHGLHVTECTKIFLKKNTNNKNESQGENFL